MTFVAASDLGASSFGDFAGVRSSAARTCRRRLPTTLRIMAIVVVAGLDLFLIALACYFNLATLVVVAGQFPSYWWLTVLLACVTLGQPAGVGTLLRGMLTEDSPRPWDSRTLLRSALVLLPLTAACFALTVVLVLTLMFTGGSWF